MEGESLEGIEEIFKLLNECNKPVLFVINRAVGETDEDDKSKDIKATINFFKQNNFNNLINEDNFIGINLVKSKHIEDFGVEDIFKRIYHLLFEKELYIEDNKDINNSIDKLYKEYINIYDNIKEEMDLDGKNIIKFKKDVNELKMILDEKFDMLDNINIENIKKNGIKYSNKCRNFISSLTDLSEILKNIDESNLPAISYFQAFMVREIGEIFGINYKEIEKEIGDYFKGKISVLKILNNDIKGKKKKENNIEEKIKIDMDIISNYLKSEYKKSNKKFIKKLVNMFNKFREKEIEELNENANGNYITKIIEKIDKNLTDIIFVECIEYMMKILEKSNGLFFFKNYFKFCEKFEKDLKDFSELNFTKHFGKKENLIIKD